MLISFALAGLFGCLAHHARCGGRTWPSRAYAAVACLCATNLLAAALRPLPGAQLIAVVSAVAVAVALARALPALPPGSGPFVRRKFTR